MARQLTSEQGWNILAGVFLAAVAGWFAYADFVMAKQPEVVVQPRQYSTSVIDQELRAPDAQNVFLKTTSLRVPSPVNDHLVQYNEGELGKVNIGRLGQ